MKKHIVNFLNKPTLVVIVSLIIASTIGVFSYIRINRINSEPSNVELTSATPSSKELESGNLNLGFLTNGRIKSISVKTGDVVKKGDILASLDPENTVGAMTQARAALMAANANYEKVVNGATSPAINVGKAAVATAETNLKEIKRQQDTLVANARRKLYSDNLVAIADNKQRKNIFPIITGVYNGESEGHYEVFFRDINEMYNRNEFSFMGLEKGVGSKNYLPQKLGNNGLLLAFPEADYELNDRWTIDIPNKNGGNYTANLNAYNASLESRNQTIATAEAALNQAEASLTLIITAARPEDVAVVMSQVESAKGALQIAEAAYNSRIIKAPEDGIISAVHISAGQIATPNAPVVQLAPITN